MPQNKDKADDIYKDWDKYKDALDALTHITPLDKARLIMQLAEGKAFPLSLKGTQCELSDLIRGALYYAGQGKPKYLEFLLIARVAQHPEFAAASPVQYAIESGQGKIIEMVKAWGQSYDPLKEPSILKDGKELYRAIIKDDPTIFKNLPITEAEAEKLLAPKSWKIFPIELSMTMGSQKTTPIIMTEGHKKLFSKLLTSCEKWFKNALTLDQKLYESLKEAIINDLYSIAPTEQYKKAARAIAGSIVRDMSKSVGLTPNLRQSFESIKDRIQEIITKHLPKWKFFVNNSVGTELKEKIMKQPEFTSGIEKIKAKMKIDTTKTMPRSPKTPTNTPPTTKTFQNLSTKGGNKTELRSK